MTQEITAADLPYLRRCVELATEAVEAGDFPFGSVRAPGNSRLVLLMGLLRFRQCNEFENMAAERAIPTSWDIAHDR